MIFLSSRLPVHFFDLCGRSDGRAPGRARRNGRIGRTGRTDGRYLINAHLSPQTSFPAPST